MRWINGISLVDGPLPLLVKVLCAVAVVFLLARRSVRWWLFALVTAVAAYLISMIGCWAVIHVFFWWPEDLSFDVVINLALLLWAVIMGGTTAFAGLRRRTPDVPGAFPDERHGKSARRRPAATPVERRVLAAVATLVVCAFVGVHINANFGLYPTVGTLTADPVVAVRGALPQLEKSSDTQFMKTPVSARWNAPDGLPASGKVMSEPIPGTLSGFTARNAVVYLPPAYFSAKRPLLPVLVLVSGQPGAPTSWLSTTKLIADLDSYADRHGGLAPLVVIPDPNGSTSANTMCLNSRIAQADTYMAEDVPNWIKTHLNVDSNPAHWAVGGFSFGGTCAVQMVTRHPEVYRSFMAISPEREPALAVERSITISRAFGGDEAAFDAQVPLVLLARNQYPTVHGWFASGSGDTLYSANVKVLHAAARKASMITESASFPGGHSWTVANEALPHGLAFMYAAMGLP
ncbi:alpha/beta hydrolase-fold protein [Arthrobacter sp. LAPM80]|uniref:alpha/beta hydrolase n=1 Tax=Arthrobacter sp. LAPM80 TaxID=3141788 RepID=UPI00398ADBF4